MKKLFSILGLSLVTLLLSFSAVNAQTPVSLSINASPSSVPAGGKGTARVTASIDGGWYMYSLTQGGGGPIPTRVTVDPGPFKLAGVSGPKPKVKFDENFKMNTESYSGNAIFNVSYTVAPDAPEGAQNLVVAVRYQVCNDSVCLPPKTLKATASVMITAAKTTTSATPETKESPSPSPSASPSATPTPVNANSNANVTTNVNSANINAANTNSVNSALEVAGPASFPTTENPDSASGPNNFSNGGFSQDMPLWTFLWAAFFAGAISLLTPCVFPMIPITVSYFTNHSEGSKAKATGNAMIFALGIIFTFTVVGLLLALLFGAAGINKFAANPYVNIFIGGLFIAFALSLFGAYELGMPSSIMTKLDAYARGKESSKYLGLLLMGLVFSVTSFTCTTPLVGGLLVLATQGSWLYPILGMIVFSAVFAFPFFLLALAPQLVAQLPRSGGWLNSVKVVMGFLEIAAAMKFISNVDMVWGWGIFTREVVLASWVAVALLITVYLLGFFQLSHDTKPERLGALRVVFAICFLSLSFYLLTGLFGRMLGELESFLPPKIVVAGATTSTGDSQGANGELQWITNDFNKPLADAKKDNKRLFIDFTGYTCTNCRWMEVNMFTRPKVRDELAKFVRTKLYTDGEGEPYEGFQKMQEEKFSTVALPLYAILDGEGKTIATFPGLTRDENEFIKFLQFGLKQ